MFIAVPVISLLMASLIGYPLARYTGKAVFIPWALLAIALVWLAISARMATGEYARLAEFVLFFLVWLPALVGLIVVTVLGRVLRGRARSVASGGVESGASLR